METGGGAGSEAGSATKKMNKNSRIKTHLIISYCIIFITVVPSFV